MTIRSRASQDRRSNSRVIALKKCCFTLRDTVHDAVVVDLSRNGAMLMSEFLPANGENVQLSIRSEHLKEELNLAGKVARGTMVTTDYGKRGRFVVNFADTPLVLLQLISKLNLT